MFLLFHGPNTFFSSEQLKKSIEDFQKQRDTSGINTVVFDAETTEPSQILEALTASPFLGEKRLVAVKRLSNSKDKDLLDALWQMVKKNKLTETTVAIFWEEELLEKKLPDFFVFLKKQKYSKFFANLSEKEMSGWIKKKLKIDDLIISSPALSYLLTHPVVNDLWQLENELNKIIAFVLAKNLKEISLETLNTFLPSHADDNTFHFIDALVAKNSCQAIKLLHDQWTTGAAEPQVFGALVWQFRNLLILKDFFSLNSGTTSDAAARALAISPFVARKDMVTIRGFSFNGLREIYRELLKIDACVKTGNGDYKTLLDFFVAKVCEK